MTDDRLRDALAEMQPSVDSGTVESALGDLHHRSARRRRQRHLVGGFASIAVLAGALAIVAMLDPSDDTQQVIADQPTTTTTDTSVTPPSPETTTTTPETTTTTEAPPVSELDDLSMGVVGLELSTWHMGGEQFWHGLWRTGDDLAQRVAEELAAAPRGGVFDVTGFEGATMRFELVDGSVVFVEIDLGTGVVADHGIQLDSQVTRELRQGLDDAVAAPWEEVDLADPNSFLAMVLADTGFPNRDLDGIVTSLEEALEAHRWWEGDHWFIDVVIEGDGPKVEIRERGLGDDSIRGVDYIFSLVDTPDGWSVGGAMSRYLCMRGVPSGPDYLCI